MEWEIKNGNQKMYGKTITLLKLEDFDNLDPSEVLIDIFGRTKKKVMCDRDTRGGYVAYGLLRSLKG